MIHVHLVHLRARGKLAVATGEAVAMKCGGGLSASSGALQTSAQLNQQNQPHLQYLGTAFRDAHSLPL